jgi:hypothetical protein
MAYLVVAVVVLGAVSVFQLVLTMGIVRRLRAQDAQLARLGEHDTGGATVDVGGRVGVFEVTATDGSTVSRAGDGHRVTAFFSPDCKACTDQLAEFARFAAGFAGEVVAVIVADDVAQGLAYQEKLAGAARIVMEPTGGAVAAAFAVKGFPAMAVTDADGLVLVNGYTVGDLAIVREVAAVP